MRPIGLNDPEIGLLFLNDRRGIQNNPSDDPADCNHHHDEQGHSHRGTEKLESGIADVLDREVHCADSAIVPSFTRLGRTLSPDFSPAGVSANWSPGVRWPDTAIVGDRGLLARTVTGS